MISNFSHGDALLPSTINALLRPTFVEVPENDGEFPIPPQINTEKFRAEAAEETLANGILEERTRAEEAESQIEIRVDSLELQLENLTPLRTQLIRAAESIADTVSWANATGSNLRTESADSVYAPKAPLSILRFGDSMFSLSLDMAISKATIAASPTSTNLEIRLPEVSTPSVVRDWLLTKIGLFQACFVSNTEGASMQMIAHLFAISAVPYVVIQFRHPSSGVLVTWDEVRTLIGSESGATLQLHFFSAI